MSEDVDRIFKISLNKIEHSKSRKLYGKSNMLHKTLLVNTVINRVRSSDVNEAQTPLMNYREPLNILDADDYYTEKTYTECQTRCRSSVDASNQKKTTSSLVSLLNSRSLCGNADYSLKKYFSKADVFDGKENDVTPAESNISNLLHKKRPRSNTMYFDEQPCAKKKLHIIWPGDVTRCPHHPDMNYSVTGLASLFGDLVTNVDAESSTITLNNKIPMTMTAC